jgi:hypothetical protein
MTKKLLYGICLLLLATAGILPAAVPRAVYADPGMKQVIFGGYNDDLNPSSTEYNSLASGYSWTGTEAERHKLVSTSGKFKSLRVRLSGSPSSGDSYTFTLRVNGADTALTVTISDSAQQGEDITHEVSVSAGDRVSLKCTPFSDPDTQTATWSVIFESNTNNGSLILGGSSDTCSTSSTEYHMVSSAYDT